MPRQKTQAGKKRSRANLAPPWQRGQSGNPNGRPRKVLSELAKKVGVDFQVTLSKEDKFTILEAMMEMSLTELKSVATDKNAPAFMVVVASAIRKDIQAGKLGALNDLFDRFFGRPDQVSKIVGKDGGPVQIEEMNADKLTDKQRTDMLKLLDKMTDE